MAHDVFEHTMRLVGRLDRRCRSQAPNGVVCTRIAGHLGWHRHYRTNEDGQPRRDEWWPA